jgi:hypothetical protein
MLQILIPRAVKVILGLLIPMLTLNAQAQSQSHSLSDHTAAKTSGTTESFSESCAEKTKEDGVEAPASANLSEGYATPLRSRFTVSSESGQLLFTQYHVMAARGNVANDETAKTQQPTSQADTAELAKKLANPVASLISFPIQTNFDFRMGSGSGWRTTTNVQPVIPIALNKDWNLISRTILPIIHQGNVTAPGVGQNGLGDVVQSLFISPNKTEPFIWGVGPAILVPTATNSAFASKQLGLGPTVVVLKQQRGWTVGALWNHIWKVAGSSERPKVNSDFIQPFLSYSTKDGWSYTLNTESTYDWTRKAWGLPIHFQVTKIVRFGKQPISFGGAMRCWATSPSGGPEGCGLRMIVTGIFPKK